MVAFTKRLIEFPLLGGTILVEEDEPVGSTETTTLDGVVKAAAQRHGQRRHRAGCAHPRSSGTARRICANQWGIAERSWSHTALRPRTKSPKRSGVGVGASVNVVARAISSL